MWLLCKRVHYISDLYPMSKKYRLNIFALGWLEIDIFLCAFWTAQHWDDWMINNSDSQSETSQCEISPKRTRTKPVTSQAHDGYKASFEACFLDLGCLENTMFHFNNAGGSLSILIRLLHSDPFPDCMAVVVLSQCWTVSKSELRRNWLLLQLNLTILVLKYVQNAIKTYKTLAGAPAHTCTCCSYPPTEFCDAVNLELQSTRSKPVYKLTTVNFNVGLFGPATLKNRKPLSPS